MAYWDLQLEQCPEPWLTGRTQPVQYPESSFRAAKCISESLYTNVPRYRKKTGATNISIQGQFCYRLQWEVGVRPDLRHVENVPAVVLCLLGSHDLKVHRPRRVIAFLNCIVQLSGMVARVLPCKLICFCLGQVLNALVRLEMDLDVHEASLYDE